VRRASGSGDYDAHEFRILGVEPELIKCDEPLDQVTGMPFHETYDGN